MTTMVAGGDSPAMKHDGPFAADYDGDQYGEDRDDDCQSIFPQRLMSILCNEKNHDAICWLPHGRAFVIRNRKLFAEKIMPRFFPRKSKYCSFTRKLNRWCVPSVARLPRQGSPI
jgi:HSF-type DNA-binding